MRRFILFFLFAVLLKAPAQTHAQAMEKAKTTVYIFLHESCRICQFYTVTLNELHETYADSQIEFVGVFPNQNTTPNDMADFKTTHGLAFDMYFDKGQVLTRKLGASITPEVVVYQPTTAAVIYRGRIDDAYFRVGQRRNVVTQHELEAVLQSLTADEAVSVEDAPAVGCFIQMVKE